MHPSFTVIPSSARSPRLQTWQTTGLWFRCRNSRSACFWVLYQRLQLPQAWVSVCMWNCKDRYRKAVEWVGKYAPPPPLPLPLLLYCSSSENTGTVPIATIRKKTAVSVGPCANLKNTQCSSSSWTVKGPKSKINITTLKSHMEDEANTLSPTSSVKYSYLKYYMHLCGDFVGDRWIKAENCSKSVFVSLHLSL